MAFNTEQAFFDPPAVRTDRQHAQNNAAVLCIETPLHHTNLYRQAAVDQPPTVLLSFGYYNPPEDHIAVEPVKAKPKLWKPPKPPMTEKEKERKQKKKSKSNPEKTENKVEEPSQKTGHKK